MISVRVRWGWGERDRSGSLSSGPGDTFLQTTQTLQGRQICREGMHHTISGALPPLLTYQPPSEGKGRSSRSCISGHRCTSSWQTVFLVFGCICGWHLYKVYSSNSGHMTGSQLHLWFSAGSQAHSGSEVKARLRRSHSPHIAAVHFFSHWAKLLLFRQTSTANLPPLALMFVVSEEKHRWRSHSVFFLRKKPNKLAYKALLDSKHGEWRAFTQTVAKPKKESQ